MENQLQVTLSQEVYKAVQHLANKHQRSTSSVVNQVLTSALHWVAAPEDKSTRDSRKVTQKVTLSPGNIMRVKHLHRVREYRDYQHVVNDILHKALEGVLHREGII